MEQSGPPWAKPLLYPPLRCWNHGEVGSRQCPCGLSFPWLLLTWDDKAVGWESSDLGSRPSSATGPMCDLGQVTVPISKMMELDSAILSSLRF